MGLFDLWIAILPSSYRHSTLQISAIPKIHINNNHNIQHITILHTEERISKQRKNVPKNVASIFFFFFSLLSSETTGRNCASTKRKLPPRPVRFAARSPDNFDHKWMHVKNRWKLPNHANKREEIDRKERSACGQCRSRQRPRGGGLLPTDDEANADRCFFRLLGVVGRPPFPRAVFHPH